MYLHDGRVQLDGFDPDAHDLLPLQLFKDAVQRAILRPAVHAGIDGVPIAEALGQPTPLASLLGHIQNRVQYRQVRHADIATLTRQTGLYAKVLRLCDLHKNRIPRKYRLVLTRPSSGIAELGRDVRENHQGGETSVTKIPEMGKGSRQQPVAGRQIGTKAKAGADQGEV